MNKRKKNFMFENFDNDFEIYNTIVIDITKFRLDAEELDVDMDCNLLSNIFLEADEDVKVNGSSTVNPDGSKQIYMTVYNLTDDYAATIMNGFIHDTLADNDLDYCDFNDARYYFVDDVEGNAEGNEELDDFNLNESYNDFPPYEEDDNLTDDFPPYEEENDLTDDFPPYEDENDEFDTERLYAGEMSIRQKCDRAVSIYINDMRLNGQYLTSELDDNTAEDIANCFVGAMDDRDYVIELIKDIYADKVDRRGGGAPGGLNEKKRGCCPPKRALSTVISEPEEFDAISESVTKVFNDIDKNAKLTDKVKKALANNKRYLHENVKIAGKFFKDLSLLELKSIKRAILHDKKMLTEKLSNTLNESLAYNLAKNEINLRNMILNYVEEELTYRNTRYDCIRKLNEDGKISDDELADLFGPAQGEETDKDNKKNDDKSDEVNSEENNNSEENAEEVELARIEITLKTPEACIDLKKACLDADIPEDAIELEGVDDSAFEEDKEESDEENKEENSEEDNNEEKSEEENKEENANESIHYKNIARLFEADEENADENNEGDNKEDNEEDDNKEDGDKEDDEEEKPEEYKFILVNTDYAKELATVLNDLYGISNEEFEEMIGGSIVSEDDEEEKESDDEEKSDKDENKDEDKSDKKDDEKKSDDDDDIDPAELFKGL